MPTNPYFDNEGTQATQEMYEDLIIQAIQVCGNAVWYIPRAAGGRHDKILGEEIGTKFDTAYEIECWTETYEGFEGQDLFQKFGVEIRDDTTFVVSRKRWNEVVGTPGSLLRPREGDLIYAKFAKALFEINEVVHEDPFYQLGHLPVYKLLCSLYRYNDESINIPATGFSGSNFAGTFLLTVTGANDFATGEIVAQTVGGVTVTAAVVAKTSTTLRVNNVSSANGPNNFVAGPITGLTSLASGTVSVVEEYFGIYGTNKEIEDETDTFTTTDPSDPFNGF